MSGNELRIVLIAVIGGFYAVLITLAVYSSKHGTKIEPDGVYDERQMADQLSACRAGMYTAIFYLLFWWYVDSGILWDRPLWNGEFGAVLGLCLTVSVAGSVCILRNAYYMVGKKNNLFDILIPIFTVLFGLESLLLGEDLPLTEDGMLGKGAAFLVAFFSCLFLWGCLLWKKRQEKREKKAAAAAKE